MTYNPLFVRAQGRGDCGRPPSIATRCDTWSVWHTSRRGTALIRAVTLLAGVLLAIAAHAADPTPRPDIAITDVSVIDVEGGRASAARTVIVSEGRILAIDAPSKAQIPPGAQRVDGRGRFLIPGLVDMHVHLFNNASKRPPNTWSFPPAAFCSSD